MAEKSKPKAKPLHFGAHHKRLGKIQIQGDDAAVRWAGAVIYQAIDSEAHGGKPVELLPTSLWNKK